MTRQDVQEMLIFGRSCLYGMAGSLPSALLLIPVWIFAGYGLVEGLRSGDDGVGECMLAVVAIVTATSGCVGLCRALIPPWTTTRRSIVKTLFCLIGGLITISPYVLVAIRDIAQHRDAHTFNPLDLIAVAFGGLALLYFVEAGVTLAWRWRRRMRMRAAGA
ncbi:hypothetical protein [Burkholderia sp. Ac-20379]|uniref:hypothetical protein n=1 Tax=Burkholderia sp. Ac-20379 TaxID=2703900 RepID=UPI00197EB53B|nr:hypothetical protein [Burkholderia sp. Ac-20379]MBN3724603.1 hypothetical protein [Burkholderia sp. Ac-20379]